MQIRSTIIWLVCLVSIALSATVHAQDMSKYQSATIEQNLTHLERIIKNGILHVAVFHQDFAPFFYTDEETGKLIGLDIELARKVAEELGVEVKFNRTAKSFNQLVDLAASEEVDVVISLLSATLHRGKKVLFTKPYVTLRSGLLINKVQLAGLNLPQNVNIIQYMKKSVVTMAERSGTSYETWTRELFPKAKLTLDAEWDNIVKMVETGQVLAVFCDETDIKKIKFQRPQLALKLQTILFDDKLDPVAMAIPATSVHLLNWLNDYLNKKNINYNVDDLMKMYPEVFSQK